MSLLTTEAEVLAREVGSLEAEGYDVFIHPRPPHTPPFLEDFVPDAVAIGNGKKLMIEVVKNGQLGDPACSHWLRNLNSKKNGN